MKLIQDLPIKIFADGADRKGILDLYSKPYVRGLTTNPTLMKKAGITDYERFAREILDIVKEKPVSFEVFSDDFAEMERQALKVASWQHNVYVKIPITNTRGESSLPLIRTLSQKGVQINITAILTVDQVSRVAGVLNPEVPSVVSVFAGRIADTGRDPEPIMRKCATLLTHLDQAELLWASVREPLNIHQAVECDCDIVTVPNEILAKAVKLQALDLDVLSLDTVKMFADDALAAGFEL